jgi:4-aminobutyrate aminotransferase-like enzyme
VCAAAGLAWDPSHSSVPDFTIHARTFTAENLTLVEVIQNQGDILRFIPPLTITKHEIDALIECLDSVLATFG